jgi:GTP cyclohydrolase IB
MIDVQSERLRNGLPIDKVGVKDLKYPIIVKDKELGSQHTVANINMYVSLPREFRGTHMSRFLEVIQEAGLRKISRKHIRTILLKIKEVLNAEAAHIEIFFPYFLNRSAPVSRAEGLMEYQCALYGEHDSNNRFHLILEVSANVLTLCPCSRELSPDTSAHNQRGHVTVQLNSGPLIWIEDIVGIIESCASSPIFTVLKRVDEKHVMDHAHNNPRFVEDIVRMTAEKLNTLHGVHWFKVAAENFEAIHNHNAYACLERGERNKVSQ